MRIFLAGAENEGHRKVLLDVGARSFLFSYLYILEKKESIEKSKRIFGEVKDRGGEIFLDSGAHSFLSAQGIREGVTVTRKNAIGYTPDEFVDIYIKYMVQMKEFVDWYAELDIGKVVGWKKVEEYRQKFWDAGLEPVLVWHKDIPNIGEEWNKWQTLPGKLLGIGDNPEFAKCSSLIGQCAKGKGVHGFAMTKPDILNRVPFYSADSTSWLAGPRFGSNYVFYGNKMVSVSGSEIKRYRNWIEEHHINYDEVIAEKEEAVKSVGAIAFIEYEKWLSEKEKRMTIVAPLQTEEAKENLKTALAVKGKGKPSNCLVCNRCNFKDKCDSFETNGVCAIDSDYEKISQICGTRKATDIMTWLGNLYSVNLKRLHRNMMFEQLDGGVADKQVSALMRDVFEQGERLMALKKETLPDKPEGKFDALTRLLNSLPEGETLEGVFEEENGKKPDSGTGSEGITGIDPGGPGGVSVDEGEPGL